MDEFNLDKFAGSSARNLKNLDKYLPDWFERDPSLLGDGVLIVGRRVEVKSGFIDFLGIDSDGCWLVIGFQKGAVGKAAFTEAIQHAASLTKLAVSDLSAQIDFYLGPKETDLATLLKPLGLDERKMLKQRTVNITLVGTASDHHLPAFPAGLSYDGSPISVIHFETGSNAAGEPVLRRHQLLLDPKQPGAKPKKRSKKSHAINTHAIDRMLRLADENGIGAEFRLFHDAAMKVGMYPRLYRWSIMYAPPQNRTRCLICVWATSDKPGLRMYIASSVFAEFYPISEPEVFAHIGTDRWDRLQADQLLEFIQSMTKMFDVITENSEKEPSR